METKVAVFPLIGHKYRHRTHHQRIMYKLAHANIDSEINQQRETKRKLYNNIKHKHEHRPLNGNYIKWNNRA